MKVSLQELDNDPDFIYTDKMDLPVLVTCNGKKEIVMKAEYSDEYIIFSGENKMFSNQKIGYRKDCTTLMPITIDEIYIKYSSRKNGS